MGHRGYRWVSVDGEERFPPEAPALPVVTLEKAMTYGFAYQDHGYCAVLAEVWGRPDSEPPAASGTGVSENAL